MFFETDLHLGGFSCGNKAQEVKVQENLEESNNKGIKEYASSGVQECTSPRFYD